MNQGTGMDPDGFISPWNYDMHAALGLCLIGVEKFVGRDAPDKNRRESMIRTETVYFDTEGSANTDEVLRIAKHRAQDLGIKTVLVASVTGETALRASEALEGLRIIAVSLAVGRYKPDVQELKEENRKILEGKGITVLTTTQAFSGVSRAVRDSFKTVVIGDIIANTLRVFGHGVKVACEISLMAADSGLVRTDEEIVAIAGTTRGADTAIVLKPVNAQRFFDLRIREILCKPRF
jgi:uncharacterized protein